MSDDPFTPAELEAGAEAVLAWETSSVTSREPTALTWAEQLTAAVLAAVLPLHAARVRAQVAEEIAQAIAALDEGARHGAPLLRAAMTARAHATTPTGDR